MLNFKAGVPEPPRRLFERHITWHGPRYRVAMDCLLVDGVAFSTLLMLIVVEYRPSKVDEAKSFDIDIELLLYAETTTLSMCKAGHRQT